MPRIGVYVSAADLRLLNELPDEVTGATIMRRAIAHFRGQHDCPATGKECVHTRCEPDVDAYPVDAG